VAASEIDLVRLNRCRRLPRLRPVAVGLLGHYQNEDFSTKIDIDTTYQLEMSAKIVILAGAPLASSLDWDSGRLLHQFADSIAQFAGIGTDHGHLHVPEASLSSTHASWRTVELVRQHLPTDPSQVHGWTGEYKGNGTFLTTAGVSFSSTGDSFLAEDISQPISSTESVEEVVSQFYEYSFALHTDVVSSQVFRYGSMPAHSTSSQEGQSLCNDKSFMTESSTQSVETQGATESSEKPPISIAGQLSNLADIPNAVYLHSIQPLTMAVSLIAGIISILPPRAIRTRRGQEVEIVELLVGDETKSGFGINCWLSKPNKPTKPPDQDLRTVLEALRPKDVILLKNVALSSFRGKVYGQSLRKDTTKIHLVYRNRITKHDMAGYYSANDLKVEEAMHFQALKTMRVREWALRFLGAPVAPVGMTNRNTGNVIDISEIMPPDTQ
jgi:hypothetical protein